MYTGDVIAVHGEMDHDGYCKATFGDQCGLVPRSFIEEMELTDSQAEQRLLNQSLSSPTPCPSAVSSVIDIVPSYDSRRAAPPSTVSSVSSLSTASTIIKCMHTQSTHTLKSPFSCQLLRNHHLSSMWREQLSNQDY